MPRILVHRIAESSSPELKLLVGLTLEAKQAGPFDKLPPIPKGGSVTIQVVFGLIPPEFESERVWVVENLEIFNALKTAGHELAAARFKQQHDLKPIGMRQVIAFPIDHPEFEIEAVA